MNDKGNAEAGKSSFGRIDSAKLFEIINLQPGMSFLDIGCGKGEYSIAAASFLGEKGNIYAIDKWEQGITLLKEKINEEKINNILAFAGDISKSRLPLVEASIDVCLMASVVHGIIAEDILESTLKEVSRVLKVGGLLAITEWKKIEGPPGPPKDIRLSPNEIEDVFRTKGFITKKMSDIGPQFYVITLVKI